MNEIEGLKKEFLQWYLKNKRDLPWRKTKEPYRIWISEVILQQTRVEQGLKYYERFLNHFSDLDSLAQAREEEVLKVWEGMGYYSRARNLHKGAIFIIEELGGTFPQDIKNLEQIPGIGPYTAAAISSICFGKKTLAIDGNIIRVISRLTGLKGYRDQREFLGSIKIEAQKFAFEDQGEFNQALMDFGATQCIPRSPNCSACPLRAYCFAQQNKQVDALPLKKEKRAPRARYFAFLVFESDLDLYVQKRSKKDIWKNLYEFPNLEMPAPEKTGNILEKLGLDKSSLIEETGFIRHVLTHQIIHANFLILHPEGFNFDSIEKSESRGKYSIQEVKKLPFPRLITNFLEERYSLYGRSQ